MGVGKERGGGHTVGAREGQQWGQAFPYCKFIAECVCQNYENQLTRIKVMSEDTVGPFIETPCVYGKYAHWRRPCNVMMS